MSRQQLKARAARDIFRRHREEALGSYLDAVGELLELELVLARDVERVGEDGVLLVDQVQISALVEQLPKVRRDGVFTLAGKAWLVTVPVRNDGVVITAAVRPS
ncbi:hypothetical protein KRX52_04440 [Pseudomonas sp. MAP12]|uniref:Uncharacterized protein n=1 Tax=Geopseudomonas aromaticivorans TaxID=2849492 RepID=A0ABS6MU21_9GAMM|nr:hypothetical protein [Pseudomonas aromaticivorans]MBV2132045.1 hypothetical protein [Pseudomonas aromaticivorans]